MQLSLSCVLTPPQLKSWLHLWPRRLLKKYLGFSRSTTLLEEMTPMQTTCLLSARIFHGVQWNSARSCTWYWIATLNFLLKLFLRYGRGRAIAQAVSRRLPTAAVQVPAQVRSCGICGGQSCTGRGFLRVLQFPLPILVPPTAPRLSSSVIRGWYNRPNSGRRTKWTQSHLTPRN
jgi:hypothetical protein